MDDRKMEIISQLMEELQEEMAHGKDDFSSRLGRKEPDVEIMSMKREDDDDEPSELDFDLGGEEKEMGMDEDCSPEEKLKQRLLKMRG